MNERPNPAQLLPAKPLEWSLPLMAPQTAWYHRNKARLLPKMRAYSKKRREMGLARQSSPEARSKWRAANQDRIRLWNANRKLLLRTSGRVTVAEWRALVVTYQGRCAYCGITPKRLEADHVIPVIHGGTNTIGNIVPACPKCNNRKRTKSAETFRQLITPAAAR
jgi:5-methylcytosine-specific restriction endonuclease McrA